MENNVDQVPPRSRMRCGVFTLNNPRRDDDIRLASNEDTSYIVFGREVSPIGRTPHLQGYFELKEEREFRHVKLIIGKRAWIARRRGSQAQAIAYQKKDGCWTEVGTPRSQGQRTDLEEIQRLVKAGMTDLEFAEYDIVRWAQFGKRMNIYRNLLIADRTSETPAPDVRVYWGETGTGKTRTATEEFPHICFHFDGAWHDGYDPANPNYLFDDFDWDEIPIKRLLKLTDRYNINVQIKYDRAKWRPRVIIFTSNHPPDEWYPNASDASRLSLMRRITEVRHFTI